MALIHHFPSRNVPRLGFALVLLVLLTGNAGAQTTPEFIYVVNNNFYALNYTKSSAADPNGSLSTITVWEFNNNALTKVGTFAPPGGDVANKDASLIVNGLRVGRDTCTGQPDSLDPSVVYNPTIYPSGYYNCFSPSVGTITNTTLPLPMGGALAVWNTIASWLNPGSLAVNDYYNGPTLWQIDTNSKDWTYGTPTWQSSFPGGNIGSSVTYSNDGNSVFASDYSGYFRVIQNPNGTSPTELYLPNTNNPDFNVPLFNGLYNSVVSIKQNPAGTKLAIGIDHLDVTLTVPAEVDIADLTTGPPYNNIVAIDTGGISAVGGMAFAPDGNLVVSNVVNDTISVISLDTESVVWGPLSLPSNVSEPVEVLFHPSGNYVYVACRGDNTDNYTTGNVVAYQYSGGQLSLIGVYPTGTITTQNLAINNPGTHLYALNSGDIGCPRCATPEPAPFPPSITVFAINTSDGTLQKQPSGLSNPLYYNNWPVDDSNFYPTGIALYAPAPRFTAVSWNSQSQPYGTATLNAIPSVLPGIVTYTEGGTTICTSSPGSSACTEQTPLSVGVHSLTATFTPTDPTAYIASSRSINYTITKATPTISWSNAPSSIYYGTALLPSQLPTASPKGTFTYNPSSTASLPVGPNRPFTATFTPSVTTDYNTTSMTVSIDVLALPTTLNLTPSSNSVNYGAAWSLSATLTDYQNNKLSGKNVTFTIGSSITLAAVTDSNGYASVSAPSNLAPGSYSVGVSFAGDSTYANASASGSVTIVGPRPTALIYTGSTSVIPGSAPTLSAVLMDSSSGKLIGNEPITFQLIGVSGATYQSIMTDATTGIASITPSSLNLATGSYPIQVKFPGDGSNSSSFTSATITVTSTLPSKLTYTGSTSTTYGQALTLKAQLTDPTGASLSNKSLTFSIGNITPQSANTDSTGTASITVPTGPSGLSAGSYLAAVSFTNSNSKSSYGSAFTSTLVQVNQSPTSLTYTGSTIVKYGLAPTLSAKLMYNQNSGLSGKTVTFTIGNSTTPSIVLAAATNSSGVASLAGPANLNAGSYTVNVSFANDPNYGSCAAIGSLQVNSLSTTLTSPGSVNVTYGSAFNLTTTLADSNGTVLPFMPVVFTIGSSTPQSAQTGANGMASVTWPAGLTTGSYKVKVSFTSTDPNYASATSASGTVQVNQCPTSLTYTGSTIVRYRLAPPLSARLTDNNGNVLPGMSVTFSIGGSTQSAQTGGNGIASVSGPPNLSVASSPYPVTVNFTDPNANYASATASSKVTVNPRPTILSYVGDTSATYGSAPNLSAQLTDSIYTGISGETIKFTIGSWTSKAVTDSSGTASVSGLTNLPVSSTPYQVTVSFGGDQNNITSSTSSTLTITKASQWISVMNQAPATAVYGSSFKVSATASSGLPVSYGSSGACTNKGATYTMASGPGACIVTFDQAGNTNYNAAAQVTESVTATAQSATKLNYTGDISTMYLVAPNLAAKLTDAAGNPLAGKLVSFITTGTIGTTKGTTTVTTTYTDSTDNSGTACVKGPANLMGPSFTVTVSFAGDQSYAASTIITVIVSITPRPTVLTYTGDTSKQFGFPPTLAAKLTDKLNGSALSGKQVTFTFNGTSMTTGTTSNGVAAIPFAITVPPQLPLGSNLVMASYSGDLSSYSPSSLTSAATLQIVNSQGTVTGSGNNKSTSFTDNSGGVGSFSVQSDNHGVSGQLQYQKGSFNFYASTMTALGISADGNAAWFAGRDNNGKTFIAYVEDNSSSGKTDVFEIWIGITLANPNQNPNGIGNLTSGNIQINKNGSCSNTGDEDDRSSNLGGFSGGKLGGDVYDDHGGHCTFSLASDGNRERGDFLYKNGSVTYHSGTMTTLSVSQDGLYAWLSGVGDDGRTFVAHVENNSKSGKMKFTLWINGAQQNNGTVKSGTIQIQKNN